MFHVGRLNSIAIKSHDLKPVLEPAVATADHRSYKLATSLVGIFVHAGNMGTCTSFNGRVGRVLVTFGWVAGSGLPGWDELAGAALP